MSKAILLALGVCVAAGVRAESGVVMERTPEQLVVRSGLGSARIGELVEVAVWPAREFGVGSGRVTEVDPRHHVLRVEWLPRAVAAAIGESRGPDRRYPRFARAPRGVAPVDIYAGDVVYVRPNGHFMEPRPGVQHVSIGIPSRRQMRKPFDLVMPAMPVGPTSTGTGPAPARPAPPVPDIEGILRRDESGVTPR